jgi:hypothetical protein
LGGAQPEIDWADRDQAAADGVNDGEIARSEKKSDELRSAGG